MEVGKITQLTSVRVITKLDQPKREMSDDMRRVALSLLNMLKREYPSDWRRLLAEMTRKV
jgi:hypothetical protein